MAKATVSSTLAAGDYIVIEKSDQGDWREISVTNFVAAIASMFTIPSGKPATQYYAPAASDFTATITDGDDDVHLILTPLAGYAAGTIKLPSVANAIDKQIVIVNCTQAITTLTMDGNGATVVGAPTAMTANSYFTLLYDIVLTTWYRIG